MTIRLVLRSSDTIDVIAPGDDAVDWSALPDALLEAYFTGTELDATKLPLVAGASPTVFRVRPLTEHERGIVGIDGVDNLAHLAYQIARFGLVEVVGGLDGWSPVRELYCGRQVLTTASLEALPWEVVQFLALVIRRLTVLGGERRRPFVSSPATGSGPTTTASASSRARRRVPGTRA